ncbi:IS982 family transposase [Rhodocytophaga rosea]|uniref:IS982 family transposase n=1 Tax=Rhodocytophaga rosea TaxID=2704465 RepID=A0A6C0GJR3_9BACT|nr:IS982 family transposase [Rhodocytophaga rosea]QHT65204.1 IS982 family transposase [Rhodocytophaga rosea]QHT68276.1 IS982 family transposase [Rhodocytophaga rosea]
MLTEIYFEVDEFCKQNSLFLLQLLKEQGYYTKPYPCQLTLSEVMTILIYYHYSGYKTFKSYYIQMVSKQLRRDFPDLVAYHRFLELIPRAMLPMSLLLKSRCGQASHTGIYYMDSSPLQVCHPKRVHQHRTFKGLADWGKTSVGWFYGFKYHILLNHQGELLRFYFSKASVSDTRPKVLFFLTKGLQGSIFADKGYIVNAEKKAFVEQEGLQLITKARKNSKQPPSMDIYQKDYLAKRGMIASVIALHKQVANIEHSRHRSPVNAFAHRMAALVAYCFYPTKPAVSIYPQQWMIAQNAMVA